MGAFPVSMQGDFFLMAGGPDWANNFTLRALPWRRHTDTFQSAASHHKSTWLSRQDRDDAVLVGVWLDRRHGADPRPRNVRGGRALPPRLAGGKRKPRARRLGAVDRSGGRGPVAASP